MRLSTRLLRNLRVHPLLLILVTVTFLFGCSSAKWDVAPRDGRSAAGLEQGAEDMPDAQDISAVESRRTDLERLQQLWTERATRGLGDFPIGPGDVVDISVPVMPELASRTVRVDSDGMISLPYVGKIEAKGLTVEELQEAVRVSLQKYMYNPRVFVYVKEYKSRRVAVLGAVEHPGMYTLDSDADTIVDVISRAGGMQTAADPLIQLIPAQPVEKKERDKVLQAASALPDSTLNKDPVPVILKRVDPILIDLRELADSNERRYLYLPVRPGDMIMVPGGGQVLVEGWVEKPGAYPVNPDLTVSGVIAAAGGPLYPADLEAVKLIRPRKDGKKTVVRVDLDKIKAGELKDIRLQGGDIIEVAAADSKLIPYGAYKFLSTVISVGIGGSIPIF